MICLHCNHYTHPDREMARVQRSDGCPCRCHDDEAETLRAWPTSDEAVEAERRTEETKP